MTNTNTNNDTNTNTDLMLAARADLGKAVASAWTGNVQSGNAIARIACNILVMLGTSNGNVTLGDVSIDADTLCRYARGTLSKTESDAKDSKLPTSGMVIRAFAHLAKPVTDAELAMDAERKAAKACKNVIIRAKHEAEIERLNGALNTLKQPIRRALMLAAFVADAGDAYALAEATVDGGKLVVPCDTGDIAEDGGKVFKAMAITYANATEAFKADKVRAPNGQTKQTGNVAPITGVQTRDGDDVASVTITPEATRKGGPQREQLGHALNVIAGLLASIDGDVTPAEREAIARLFVACEAKLDDQAMERVADLRDVRDGVAAA